MLSIHKFPETFYFFGDNDVEEWKEFLDEYKIPPLNLPRHRSALSFGLAGPGTGVPFHFHGPGLRKSKRRSKLMLVLKKAMNSNFKFSLHHPANLPI